MQLLTSALLERGAPFFFEEGEIEIKDEISAFALVDWNTNPEDYSEIAIAYENRNIGIVAIESVIQSFKDPWCYSKNFKSSGGGGFFES